MSEIDMLEAEIRFGAEVQQFLSSSVGRYLLGRSKEEIDSCVDQLKTVDPEDAKAIRELQCAIKRNEEVESWLADAIQQALDARDLVEGIE